MTEGDRGGEDVWLISLSVLFLSTMTGVGMATVILSMFYFYLSGITPALFSVPFTVSGSLTCIWSAGMTRFFVEKHPYLTGSVVSCTEEAPE